MRRVIRAPRPVFTFEISSHQRLFTALARTNHSLSLSGRNESAPMSLLALQISEDRLVRSRVDENDKPPVVKRGEGEGGGARREPGREIDGTSRWVQKRFSRTVHENPQRVSIREWLCVEKESGRPRPPLEKWLVKLIRAKWGLNGVGIDRAAGFCTTGTSRMFGHPSQLPG